MAAIKKAGDFINSEFYLLDYESVDKRRLARIDEDGFLEVSGAVPCMDSLPRRGVVGEGKFGAKSVPMAFLSPHIDAMHGTPDYCRSLVLMIDGKLMGDGFLMPEISWSKRCISKNFVVTLEDGWKFEAKYTAPFIREFLMRLNVGGPWTINP